MFENISHFFRRMVKPEQKELGSKDAAKERLHLVLMQDRANVSADFLELMKQEIIDVIKKYIVVDESSIDVRLTNKSNDDGTNGAPALYANIPIVNIKNDMMAEKEKKFEGVDFNKEMGITEFSEEELQEKLQPLELEEIPNQEVEENKTTVIENYSVVEEKTEEVIEQEIASSVENTEVLEKNDIDDDEDDDDDEVTFDDLLKVAEAAEKAEKELEKNKEDVEEISTEKQEELVEDKKENAVEKEELVKESKEDSAEENKSEAPEKKTRGRKKKKK